VRRGRLVSVPARPSTGISFEKIEKRYGGIYALLRVSLEVGPGECVVIAGHNGSGKTTLLRIGAKLIRPTGGTIRFHGPDGEEQNGARTGFVAHSIMVYDELTAMENLTLFARLQDVPDGAGRIESLLGEVGLAERKDSLVRTFSRGMRQRIALARALLCEPALLLLDEPATGLDTKGTAWLAARLQRLRDEGCTILMSLHGESEISEIGTRGIRLERGSVVADTRQGASVRSILAVADV
jgi:heme ABC exporter ATP-binding subunit CcmA